MTFEQLHNSLPKIKPTFDNVNDITDESVYNQLDCLLKPKNKSVDWEAVSLKITGPENEILNIIQDESSLIYAMVAPAFLGQFSQDITPGKLRSALKFLGFNGMVEVSLFADILTLKEALEFIYYIRVVDRRKI